MINVSGLTVKYKNLIAVDNISFSAKQGEIFGVIGPNGAGKTSTIECLEGLREPSSGKIEILGINPANRKKLYGHIGVQLQEASFPDAIKLEEVCRLFSSFYDNPVDYNLLLERFDLADKKTAYVNKLSGGQKQKASIVVALIGNPKILFLDELTTGLDPQARINMWELIKSLREEGKTIFMTTHFMDEAEYLCDRVCIMVKGKIAAIGSIKELVAQADLSQRVSFTAKNIEADSLRAINGVKKVLEHNGTIDVLGNDKNLLRDIVVYLTEHNADFSDLHCTNPGLEDVFLKSAGFRLGEFE